MGMGGETELFVLSKDLAMLGRELEIPVSSNRNIVYGIGILL